MYSFAQDAIVLREEQLGYVLLRYSFNLDTQKQLFDDVKSILNEIAYLFQIQNDYMDMYADSNVTKKTMNDIENGAFCWMSTMAMELGTDEQKDVMKKFYGKDGKK